MTDESIIDVTTKKNIILDATTLTSIMNCARFTDLRFNHQLVQIGGKSNSLECGSIVHKVLEVAYRNMIHGIKRSDAIQNGLAAGEMYIKGCPFCTDFTPHSIDKGIENGEQIIELIEKPSCNHPINEYPGVKNTPAESTSKPDRIGWKYALQTCEEYFDYYKSDFWTPLEVETVKRKLIYEDEEIRILWKAKLDWIIDNNQGQYPVDHKTMKQRRDSLSLNNQFMGQCIVIDTRNMFINKIGFQTSLKAEEKFTRVVMSYSSDRLIEFQSEIVPYWAYQLVQYNESGYWPPNYSNCEGKFGNCVFSDVCRADRGMRNEELKNNFIVGQKWDIDNVEEN